MAKAKTQIGGCKKRPNDTPARRKYKLMGVAAKNKARRIAKQAKKEAKATLRADIRKTLLKSKKLIKGD
jgi:hypothetical protein